MWVLSQIKFLRRHIIKRVDINKINFFEGRHQLLIAYIYDLSIYCRSKSGTFYNRSRKNFKRSKTGFEKN